jgi:hypothetical protein
VAWGGSVVGAAVHSGFEAAAVEAGEAAGDLVGKERIVFGGDEQFGDAPDVFFGGHPVLAVKTREVDGYGVVAQGAFAAEVVVVLEVAEGELAEGAVDGGAEAEAGEVGLGDASPEAALAIEGDDVVVVAHGFEIHEQRRVAVEAQGGGGEQRSLHAMSLALAQGALRRPGGVGILVGQGVEEALDFGWGLERAQCTQGMQILGREAEGLVSVGADCGF